ncbi:MAG: PAS domain S-box protein [bacterium]|nr:PAS domain S-box protein [bacterium]
MPSHRPTKAVSKKKVRKDRKVTPSSGGPRDVREKKTTSPNKSEHYQILFRQARDAMFVADLETRKLTDANRAALRLTGYSKTKLLTMKADELHPPDVRAVTMAAFRRHGEGSPEEVETLLQTVRGKQIPVAINTSRIEVDGRAMLLGIFRDVSANKAVEARLKQAQLKAETLSHAALAMVKMDNPVKGCTYLLDQAKEITASVGGFLGTVDQESGFLVSATLPVGKGRRTGRFQKKVIATDFRGPLGKVMKGGKILWSKGKKDRGAAAALPFGPIRIADYLLVPSVSKGKVIGIMGLSRPAGLYSDEAVSLITELSKLVTIALLNFRKYLEEERAAEIIAQGRDLQQKLLKISRDLPLARTLPEAWPRAARQIAGIAGAVAASLYIPEEQGENFQVAGIYGLSRRASKTVRGDMKVPVSRKTLAGRAFLTGKPAVVFDAENDKGLERSNDLSLVGGYRSVAAIPIMADRTCLGVGVFYFKSGQALSQEQVDLLELAIQQLTPALSRIAYGEKIVESESRYRALVENALVGVYLIQDGVFKYVNPMMAEIFGYTPEELLHEKGPEDLTDSADWPLVKRHIQQGITGERDAIHYRFKGRRKTGEALEVEVFGSRVTHQGGAAVTGMVLDVTERIRVHRAMTEIAGGTTSQVGDAYFRSTVEFLSKSLEMDYALVGEVMDKPGNRVRTLAVYAGGQAADNFEYDLADTPCETVLGKTLCAYTSSVQAQFPKDQLLREMAVESYVGTLLLGSSGRPLGILAVMGKKPLSKIAHIESTLRIMATRASAEMERKQAEERLQRERDFSSAVIDTIGSVVTVLDREGRIVRFNKASEQLTGYTLDTVQGKFVWELLIPPSQMDAVREVFQELKAGHFPNTYENHWVTKSGELRLISWSNTALMDSDGRVEYIIATGIDVTEHRRAEEARKSSHERMLLVLNSLDALVYVADLETHEVLFVNEYGSRIFGDITGEVCWKTLQNDQLGPCPFCTNDRLLTAEGKPTDTLRWEFQNSKTGQWFDIRDRAIPWVDGRLVRLEIATDITERKELEATLERSRESLWEAQEIAKLGNWDRDLVKKTLQCSDEVYRIFRFEPQVLVPTYENILERVHPEDRQRLMGSNDAALAGDTAHDMDYRIVLPDGTIRIVHEKARVFRDEEGKAVRVVGTVQDVTEQKEAEAALEASESRYCSLFQDAAIVLFEEDFSQVKRYMDHLRAGGVRELGSYFQRHPESVEECLSRLKVVDVNQAALNLLGAATKDELIRNLPQVFTSESLHVFREELIALSQGRTTFEAEAVVRSLVGEEKRVLLHLNVAPGYEESLAKVIVSMLDITERSRLEEELSRSQRLEAAGRLAGQIAHDFNNLLSPLMAYPDLIRLECKSDDPMLPLVDQMQSVAQQMSEINQQLLTLGRRGHYNQTIIDLRELLERFLLSFTIPSTIRLRKAFEDGILPIRGGEAQLNRIFTNLTTNAVEAMDGIGTLSVSVENCYLDRAIRGYETVQKGEYVRVDMEDSGTGVESEILQKIFEPFFTTKKTDKVRGSGLGLSVVRAVMEDHNGYIDIETRPGAGTRFSLFFPITRESVPFAVSAEPGRHGSGERILIVDDDPVQRQVLGHLLTQIGYKTHAVANGAEAVAHVRECPQDLLVLDMVMEDSIDGTETYRQIREFSPHQRALILSGYAESERVDDALKMGVGGYLRKPVNLKTIAAAVREQLDKLSPSS